MSTEAIAAQAATLHREALVWEMTMPLLQGSDFGLLFGALERMRRSGYDFVSLTLAADHTGTGETLRNLALLRALLLARGRNLRLVRRAGDVRRARTEGRLAVARTSLHPRKSRELSRAARPARGQDPDKSGSSVVGGVGGQAHELRPDRGSGRSGGHVCWALLASIGWRYLRRRTIGR